jgi:hypothetical protein
MNQLQIDKCAEAIAENINIDEVIFQALENFLSGSNVEDDDRKDIDSSVRYALINNLKGRF